MWNWIKWAESALRDRPRVVALREPRVSSLPSRAGKAPAKYVLLHHHLEGRFADTVVLTLQQIEDLLGFELPASAHSQPEWWTMPAPHADASPHSGAWLLAGRTARPNLPAGTVTFERVSP